MPEDPSVRASLVTRACRVVELSSVYAIKRGTRKRKENSTGLGVYQNSIMTRPCLRRAQNKVQWQDGMDLSIDCMKGILNPVDGDAEEIG